MYIPSKAFAFFQANCMQPFCVFTIKASPATLPNGQSDGEDEPDCHVILASCLLSANTVDDVALCIIATPRNRNAFTIPSKGPKSQNYLSAQTPCYC